MPQHSDEPGREAAPRMATGMVIGLVAAIALVVLAIWLLRR